MYNVHDTFIESRECFNFARWDYVCILVQDGRLCYLNNHLDGGQRGCQVLGVGGSDSDWHTASVQAAVESGNQVDSYT